MTSNVHQLHAFRARLDVATSSNIHHFTIKVRHILEETWDYLQYKLEACLSKTEYNSCKCPICCSTVQIHHLYSAKSKHNHLIVSMQVRRATIRLCLKSKKHVLTENKASHFDLPNFLVLYYICSFNN